MKKLLSLLFTLVLIAGVGLGVFFIVKNTKKEENYDIVVSSSSGGSVSINIDGTSYTISAGYPVTYTVENKTEVTLTSQPETGYSLKTWSVDGSTYSTETSIKLKITKNISVKANFDTASVNLTITDTNLEETKTMPLTENLLSFLNSTYVAPKGYTYTFYCNGSVVTSSTTLTADATITRVTNLINYSVNFVLPNGYTFDGTNNTQTINYNIENVSSLTAPNLPTANEGKVLAWEAFSITENNLGEVTTVNAVETSIPYTATLVLPEGCTFEDNSTTKDVTYYYGETEISFPQVNAPSHYQVNWPDYTLTYNENTPVTITATISAIPYTVTFMNDTETIATETYTIENKSITEPSIPSFENSEHYNSSWETYSLDSLTNLSVNLVKVAKTYTVTFKNGDDVVSTPTYTIENKSITEPSIPSFENSEHYNLSWEAYSLDSLTNLTVNLVKVAKTYTVTFKNGDDVVDTQTYTIENKSITEPDFPTFTNSEHYNLSWSAYSLDSLTNLTVNLVKTAKTYTAIFMHNGVEYDKQTFTIENNSITEPDYPTSDDASYIYVWEDYTHKLKDYTINSVKVNLVIHTIEFDSANSDATPSHTFSKVAYYNNNVYVLTSNNSVLETYTITEFATLLFNDAKDGSGDNCELTINNVKMSAVSESDDGYNKLVELLSSETAQTITLIYTEEEVI